MMRRFFIVSVGLATLCLVTAFALRGHGEWTLATVIVSSLWLTESQHGLRRSSALSLSFFVAAAAVGVLLELPSLLLLSGVVAALAAWDLYYFGAHLDYMADVHNNTELVRGHIKRLGSTAGLGWLLGALALGVRLNFSFVVTLALALLIVVSLGLAMRRMTENKPLQ